ncbi:hypothetical protein [Lysobacter sp. CA199]|uniref:hypothetical protein n=1 Tax=Lysobacter sp. CA199 TaxID=3455608 RepID=UPI003F8D733E
MDEHTPKRATPTANGIGNAADPSAAAAAASPQRLSGEVRELDRKMQTLRRSGRHGGPVQFTVYRFRLDHLRLAFYEPVDSTDTTQPPLSEGDRVELVAQHYAGKRPDPEGRGDDGAVAALHNLESDRRYVCHSIFRWLILDLAPVGYTPRMLREALYWSLVLSLLGCAGVAGLSLAVSPSTPWPLVLGDCAKLVAFFNAVIWIPVAVLQLRWRLGRPTRRQVHTERVYAALGFGSPLRPAPGLIEL